MSIYEKSNIENYLLLENLKLFCEIVFISSRMFQNFCLVFINVICRLFLRLDLKLLQNNTNSPGGTSLGKVQTPTSAGSEASNTFKFTNTLGNGKVQSPSSKCETPNTSKKSAKHKPHDNFRNAFLLGEFSEVLFLCFL